MSKFVLGVFVTLLLIAIAGYSYFAFGYAPVATASAPIPFETTLAKLALKRVVENQMPKDTPMAASEQNILVGAHLYRTHCAVCHGLPGQPQTAIAKGEFPKPPELFKGKGVSDDTPGETWWKVANGIRLTGMPAFKESLTGDQVWQVSLLLANSDKLPASVKSVLQAPLPE